MEGGVERLRRRRAEVGENDIVDHVIEQEGRREDHGVLPETKPDAEPFRILRAETAECDRDCGDEESSPDLEEGRLGAVVGPQEHRVPINRVGEGSEGRELDQLPHDDPPTCAANA